MSGTINLINNIGGLPESAGARIPAGNRIDRSGDLDSMLEEELLQNTREDRSASQAKESARTESPVANRGAGQAATTASLSGQQPMDYNIANLLKSISPVNIRDNARSFPSSFDSKANAPSQNTSGMINRMA
ncbi:MAG: hypothetical protein WC838_07290 [Candidatus Margulisiibacteriota bacterium]|jgi:hypothetical protein